MLQLSDSAAGVHSGTIARLFKTCSEYFIIKKTLEISLIIMIIIINNIDDDDDDDPMYI